MLFANAKHVSAGRADYYLRFHMTEYGPYNSCETGHVESPMGHVMVVQITSDDIAAYASSEGDPWITERRNFEPGWYLIRTDNQGFVFGNYYDSFESAIVDYEAVDAAYEVWAGGQGL